MDIAQIGNNMNSFALELMTYSGELTAQVTTSADEGQAVAIEGLKSEQIFSPLVLFQEADPIVKAVLIVLALVSILSWAVIIERWLTYRRGKKQWGHFSHRFWSGTDLRELSNEIGDDLTNPFALLFVVIMREYRNGAKSGGSLNQKLDLITRGHCSRLLEKLELRLSWLASISSTAPFIGLLGTVWGIMHSFQSIAQTQQSHLAIVAPGIAEALFATAAGLFAAIPAGFAYNLFVARKESLMGSMERFADDLIVTLLRHQDNK